MKAIGRKAVFIYSGLDVILQITSVDPLEQIYYAGSDSFIPDRTLTPLVLTPRAQVKDKKGISMPSELANVAWYIGTPDEKNRVTSRTQTDDYYLDGLNLVVRKNLEVPQQIYVKAEYLDTRTKTTITIPQVVQLSISKSSEIAPAPTCSIDRPSDWSINPLKDAAIQDLSATIFKDEKAYQGAVKWNKSFNGIKSEIVEEDDFYISGQLTNSLKIDTDKLPSGALIGCENPSEEFYNKVYGINPEWDNRMKEVFENRNLALNTNNNFVAKKGALTTTPYTFASDISKGTTISFAYKSNVSEGGVSTFFGKTLINEFKPNTNNVFVLKEDVAKGDTIAMNLTTGQTVNEIDLSELKIIIGDKSTPYTPAPEDLNWENMAKNQLENLTLYGAVAKRTLFKDNIKYFNDITYSGDTGDIYGLFILLKAYVLKDKPTGFKFTLKFKLKANKDTAIELTSNNTRYTLESSPNVKKDTEYTFAAYMEIINGNGTHFNTHVNLKDKPTNIQIYEMGIYEGHMDLPYFPTAKELAPDGIIKGTYEADVPMFVKYPDTLDISMKPLPLIPEGVEELELEVEATTSAGTLNNPAKYFDIDYYLSNYEEAGVEPVKVGSGNSVKVTREQLKERPEYYLEWNYKPRPTTLNKKQSQSMDK